MDAYVLCALDINKLTVIRDSHHHPVAIDIAYGGGEGEIGYPRITRNSRVPRIYRIFRITGKESHWSAEFEVMLYLIILALAMHLDHELVERVIVALPHFYRPPGITTFHLPLQPHLLGLFAVGFLLGLILHLEQQPLLLECQYRRILLITHKSPAKLQNRNEYLKEIGIIRIIII